MIDFLIAFGVVVIAVWYLYRHVAGLVRQDGKSVCCSGGCGGCTSKGKLKK